MRRSIGRLAAGLFAWESRLLLRRHRPKVVGVTGSVGKTTTRDMVAAVLRERFEVRQAPGNFNANVLVPLAVLGLPHGGMNPLTWIASAGRGAWHVLQREQPDWLVLEIGAGQPGEIDWVSGWLSCDVVVLTRFPDVPAHLAVFGSRERLLAEKARLLSTLDADGTVVVNADDLDLMRVVRKQAGDRRSVTYGLGPRADARGRQASVVYDGAGLPLGMEFEVEFGGDAASAVVPGILGEHHLYAVLGAVAVAANAGIDPTAAMAAIAAHDYQPGRMTILSGIRGSVVIDDAFNTSPASAEQALACLATLSVPGRRIAVLGEMRGLGELVDQEHRKLGGHAAASDRLLAVGPYADRIAEGAVEAGLDETSIRRLPQADGWGDAVEEIVGAGDAVLIKGHGLRGVVERISQRPAASPNARDGAPR